MKRFFIAWATSVVWLAVCAIAVSDEPDGRSAKPSDTRSYTQGFAPQLGGAYRNPDAYLPYYPGYAPYWQSAPLYPYAYPALFYPYGFYPQPVDTPPNQFYGPRGRHRNMWH